MQQARSFWLPCAAVAYICFAALQAERGVLPWLALVVLPFLVAEVWRRTALPSLGEDRIVPSARSALRACFWGAAIWLAARSGPAGRSGFDAAANLGAGTACVAALVALARVGSLGGMLIAHPATRSLDAAAFAGLAWGIAVALPATRALLPNEVRLDPLAIDYATTTAGVASLLVLVAASWRLRLLRRLEIGVADRAAGALALTITAFTVAVPAAGLDVAPPDRVLPIAVVVSSLLCTWAATTPEPTTVSSALRGIIAIMILGAPTTTVAGLLARGAPRHAGAIVLCACCVSIIVGLISRAVAKPLGPEQSRWLDAIEAASRGALEPEPDSAIRAALVALGGTTSTGGSRPELWRIDPEQVLSVDIAGYLHVAEGQAPPRLYELALAEPERTLRAEALAALEVRRPEVRPLLAWFEARRAFSATAVLDVDGPLGFILLPRGNRTSPMTLEEARAVRLLADRISALLAVSSALARSRQREISATQRADEVDDERQRLEHFIQQESGRRFEQAERAARPVRGSAYSPAARLTLERLERLGRGNAPVTLIVPPGVDPIGWAAVVHLASPRCRGSLVVIDGTSGYEHDLAHWEDPERSPLTLADGGTLLILDAACLTPSVQEYVARALARKTNQPPRSSLLPPGLVVSASEPLDALVSAGRVDKALARWLGDAHVLLPGLRERAEDLRTLVLSALTKAGLCTRGEPLGIEPKALRLLTEHTWPANELELVDVLTRAASITAGPVVTAAELSSIGFCSVSETAIVTPLPTMGRRRPPRRMPRGP